MKISLLSVLCGIVVSLPYSQRVFDSDLRLIRWSENNIDWVSSEFLEEIDCIRHGVHGSPDVILTDLIRRFPDVSPAVIKGMMAKTGFGPGYVDITSYADDSHPIALAPPQSSFSYSPAENSPEIVKAVSGIDAKEIKKTISSLSHDFTTRYHKSSKAVQVPQWIKGKFEEIRDQHGRDDVIIELFTGKSSKQPSVIVTIPGIVDPEAIVIVGAHEDSISMGSRFNPDARAPGADDDASGVASVLEMFRVLMEQKYFPKKTLKVMAFAAEEAGLLGSLDIARFFSAESKNIVAMLQVEMNGYKKSGDIVILRETNEQLATYLLSLAKLYLPEKKASLTKCQYGCSDHYSFHNQGYAATAIAEAGPSDAGLNPHIHTSSDTVDKLDPEQVANYAKLALSFAMDMTK